MIEVDLEKFCEDYDVAIVVVSRDRAEMLYRRTDAFLRGYKLFYSGEGYDDYDYHATEKVEVPRGIRGLSPVRNWVLDHVKENVVIFLDDDISAIVYVLGAQEMKLSIEQVKAVWVDTVLSALDLGVAAFGLSELPIMKASPLQPMQLRAVFGSVFGVIGRDFRFDERNLLKCDYDFCLQTIVEHRIIYKNMRYAVRSDKDGALGGNMTFRTPGRRQKEIENLKKWWGDDVFKEGLNKNNERLAVHIP